MNRMDRLFQIVQSMRHNRITTAQALSDEFGVSVRTIYRDIDTLSLSGIPVISEPGKGYQLMDGFDLPPLMFTEDELSSILLGARMVQAWSDQSLSHSAAKVLEKIEAIIPDHLKPELLRNDMLAPNFFLPPDIAERFSLLRTSIKSKHKVTFKYNRKDGKASQRIVWPLGLFFWGKVWTLTAWCELRKTFRNFRIDRMRQLNVKNQIFTDQPGKTLDDYLQAIEDCDSVSGLTNDNRHQAKH